MISIHNLFPLEVNSNINYAQGAHENDIDFYLIFDHKPQGGAFRCLVIDIGHGTTVGTLLFTDALELHDLVDRFGPPLGDLEVGLLLLDIVVPVVAARARTRSTLTALLVRGHKVLGDETPADSVLCHWKQPYLFFVQKESEERKKNEE